MTTHLGIIGDRPTDLSALFAQAGVPLAWAAPEKVTAAFLADADALAVLGGTRERFRRRGICSALLRHLQVMAAERGAAGLYLYDSDEAPDRIYARAGFQLVAQVRSTQLVLASAAVERSLRSLSSSSACTL